MVRKVDSSQKHSWPVMIPICGGTGEVCPAFIGKVKQRPVAFNNKCPMAKITHIKQVLSWSLPVVIFFTLFCIIY